MRYTAQEEYGLRCLLQLARHDSDEPMAIEEIARKEGLTPHYVGKLMRILLKGGLIESTRGKNGGYRLSRPAEHVSIEEALDVLDGRLYTSENCKRFTGDLENCVNSSDCSVRVLWTTVDRAVSRVLQNTMLTDLIPGTMAAGINHQNGSLTVNKTK
ncbi:RrF2 family transcriptional regulator [candidate division KSB1 bacterium]